MSLFSFLRFRAFPLDREQVELFNGVLTRPLNTFVIGGFTMICTNEDTKLINEIMRDFTNITKIAAIFVNNRGKVLSQEYNFSPFCKVVRRNPAYAKRCNQCDLYGGLDATKDGLFVEKADSPYANLLSVNPGDENKPAIQKLAKALQSPEVKKFIEEHYKGAIIPAF